jgi:hypothetical protein
MNISPTDSSLPLVSDTLVNKYVTDEQIFSYYLPSYSLGSKGAINSPFRDDSKPSFGIFYADKISKWLFKDAGINKTGGAFSFVQELHKLNSYFEAVCKVAEDFGLGDKMIIPNSSFKPVDKKRIYTAQHNALNTVYQKDIIITPITRDWDDRDKRFWYDQYRIKKSTLDKFNVLPITHIKIQYGDGNVSTIKQDNFAYAYEEYKDGIYSYKIYQPFNEKHKWRNNIVPGAHFGYRQLPDTRDILIITKSGKDVMAIHDTLGIPSIAIQAESHRIKKSVMDEYKKRFKKVYILFDNDEAGIKAIEIYKQLYDGIHILSLPKDYPKDFSDTIKYKGVELTKQLFKNL